MFRNSTFNLALAFLFAALPSLLFSQQFTAVPLGKKSAILESQFKSSEIYRLDLASVDQFAKSSRSDSEMTLNFGGLAWSFKLQPSRIFTDDYVLRVKTERGIETRTGKPNIAFEGWEKQGGEVKLVITPTYFSGRIDSEGETFYIEPLFRFEPNASPDLLVVYKHSDVIDFKIGGCIALEIDDFQERNASPHGEHSGEENSENRMLCYESELAIASDKSMYTKYSSSVANVEAHNVAVINNVNTNYSGQFTHDIEHVINVQFVVTGNDPWTASTDAVTLLGDFRVWGQNNGFGTSDYDLGELWTNRDFNGATVGIAYVGGLCTPFRYHCLQDYTANAAQLRCMTSHEMGHNFDADHDNCTTVNFIMCPFVTTSNTWSALSISVINPFIASKIGGNCLETCGSGGGGGGGATAEFSWDPDPGCTGQPFSFFDGSTGSVSSWNWTFPGGTPATSTQQDPTVTWATAGTRNVTLSINGGASSVTHAVTILAGPVASFSFTQTGSTFVFDNNSTGATSYLWNFGDGFTSTQANPTHTYTSGGTYTVTLTANGPCGSDSDSQTVNTGPTVDFAATPQSGCPLLTVQFTELASPDATSFEWVFPGGNPASSTAANPIVNYSNAGSFEVTLTATNAFGNSTTATKFDFIEVFQPTTAGFNFSQNGLTVSFTNTSVNATSFTWHFGDGATSTQASPTHTYASEGNYNVTLIANGQCGTDNESDLIQVVLPPVANFTATPTSGCNPLTVTFSDQSTGAFLIHNWTFPGGNPNSSTDQNPTVTYANGGVFDVILSVTNPAGTDTETKDNFITVNTVPDVNFTFSVNGTSATFTNNTLNATSYLWNFGDGATSTAANPTHTYTNEGTFTVTLTATNACGGAGASEALEIVLPPVADFTYDPNPAVSCTQLTVHFQAISNGGAATSYAWNFPGGSPSTSTAENPTVTYSNAGTYSVVLTIGNAAGSNTITQPGIIQLGVAPATNFSHSTNGTTASFTNTSIGANTYLWDFGDGATSTASDPTHTYQMDGTYAVTLTSANACGTHTSVQNVVIVTPPTANFSFSPANGCTPLTVQYASTSSANSTSFSWNFPGGSPSTSTAQNPTVVYENPGTFSANLTVANAAGNNTAAQTNIITVGSAPTSSFTANVNGSTTTFINGSTGATSYAWDFGDGNTSTTQNPIHTFASDGVYTVTLTSTNACGPTVYTQNVTVITPPTAGFSFSPGSGCSPLTVQFANTSTANATNWSWSFPGGTPATSTDPNPVVTYSVPGIYSVSMTASNSAGSNTASQSSIINVGTVPTPAFSATTTGATASFSNTSTGAVSQTWNFGDGNSSTDQNPSHTYANDGTYTVTLTSTNACGSSTSTQTVAINTPPTAGFSANFTSGCAPFTVQFNSTASANTSAWNWEFPGGQPETSTEQNPTVTYSAAGTYTVSQTVSNVAGSNSTTQMNFVNVGTVPVTSFSATTNGATASFSNTSTGSISQTWDFGDGNSSSDQNPSHAYANDGTYTVTLTTTNACGSSTSTQNVTIVTPPTAGFSASVNVGCAPFTVQFNSTASANSAAWSWSFPGGQPETSTEQNPTVTYSVAGTYLVSQTVSNPAGSNTSTQSNFINVGTTPLSSFEANVSGTSVSFTNTSIGATSYSWDFGDGQNSTEENPTHNFPGDGIYGVTLTATNACGTVQSTQNVTIVTPPTASFSASSLSGCLPLTANFTNNSSANATNFEWQFEGGSPASSNSENAVSTWDSPGIYTVTLTVSNAAGTSQTTTTIEVSTVPESAFSTTTGGLSVFCANNSVNADSYTWDFGDGQTSTEASPTHDYADPGAYTVTLVSTNECGSSTTTATVTISGSAPATNFSANSQNGCLPAFTVNFIDQSVGNPTAWSWAFPGGSPATSTEQNPVVTYSSAGTYDVSLTATNVFGSNTASQVGYITVGVSPTSAFDFVVNNATVDFGNNSQNASTYEWNFGDGTTSTEANPTHVYTASGTYLVTLVSSNDCGSSVLQKEITVVVVGTGEAGWVENFKLFPNPTSGEFTIEMVGQPAQSLDFEVFNSIGQMVLRDAAEFGTGKLKKAIDLGAAPAGVYNLRVRADGKAFFAKVVVQ